jgi:hypothetical protein
MEVAICSLKCCEREMRCPKAPPNSPKEAIQEVIGGISLPDSVGKRCAGYSIVSLMGVIESYPLPWGTTSQKA